MDEHIDTQVEPVSKDKEIEDIVGKLREANPKIRIFQIIVPDRKDELFLVRKASWSEYKRLIGAVKNDADANEILVQKFLVHPKPNYEEIQSEWDPGLVVTLAQQIQKGLGFAHGATIKKW